jgi:hypothetical protein
LPAPLALGDPCDGNFYAVHQRELRGDELVDVDFGSPTERWAVGSRESAPPLIVRFDEESFEVIEGLPRFAGSVFLKDGSALTREQVFVAGPRGR